MVCFVQIYRCFMDRRAIVVECLPSPLLVLQRVAECCRVLQCVAVCCRVLQSVAECCRLLQSVAACCSVFQCVPVCVAVRCSTWQVRFGVYPYVQSRLPPDFFDCRTLYVKRDLHMSKETCTYKKRPMCTPKETQICQETHRYAKRHIL